MPLLAYLMELIPLLRKDWRSQESGESRVRPFQFSAILCWLIIDWLIDDWLCVCVYVQTHMHKGQRLIPSIFYTWFHLTFWRQGLSQNLELWSRDLVTLVGWWTPGIWLCLPTATTGVIDACSLTQIFVSTGNLSHPYLHSKHFTNWATSSGL